MYSQSFNPTDVGSNPTRPTIFFNIPGPSLRSFYSNPNLSGSSESVDSDSSVASIPGLHRFQGIWALPKCSNV
jgi:hypothetical protein